MPILTLKNGAVIKWETSILLLLLVVYIIIQVTLADSEPCLATQYWDNGTETCAACLNLCQHSQKRCATNCPEYCLRVGCPSQDPSCTLVYSDSPLRILIGVLSLAVLLLVGIVTFMTCNYIIRRPEESICGRQSEDRMTLLPSHRDDNHFQCIEHLRLFLREHNVPRAQIEQCVSVINDSSAHGQDSQRNMPMNISVENTQSMEPQDLQPHEEPATSHAEDNISVPHQETDFSVHHSSLQSSHKSVRSQISSNPTPPAELSSVDLRTHDFFSSDVVPQSLRAGQQRPRETPTLDRAVENIRVGRSQLRGASVVHVTVYDDGIDVYVKQKDPTAELSLVKDQLLKMTNLPGKRLRVRIDDPPIPQKQNTGIQHQISQQKPESIKEPSVPLPSRVQAPAPPLDLPKPAAATPQVLYSSVGHSQQDIHVHTDEPDEPLLSHKESSEVPDASGSYKPSSHFLQEQPQPDPLPAPAPAPAPVDDNPWSSGISTLPSIDRAIEQLRERRYEVIGATVVHVTIFDNALDIHVRPHPVNWNMQSVHQQLSDITGMSLAKIRVFNDDPPGKPK